MEGAFAEVEDEVMTEVSKAASAQSPGAPGMEGALAKGRTAVARRAFNRLSCSSTGTKEAASLEVVGKGSEQSRGLGVLEEIPLVRLC